jgi:hypothetical protein
MHLKKLSGASVEKPLKYVCTVSVFFTTFNRGLSGEALCALCTLSLSPNVLQSEHSGRNGSAGRGHTQNTAGLALGTHSSMPSLL